MPRKQVNHGNQSQTVKALFLYPKLRRRNCRGKDIAMKENYIKAFFTTIFAFISSILGVLAVPVILMVVCNIIDYAKKVCGEERIAGVIGGFHLLEMTPRVKKTADYLKTENPQHLCPCHCTSFHARAAIHARIPVEEVCVGDTLELR